MSSKIHDAINTSNKGKVVGVFLATKSRSQVLRVYEQKHYVTEGCPMGNGG